MMMKTYTPKRRITGCALAALAFAQGAAADVAGTVLFAQTGTQIVSESGATRAAKKGDVLQTGERLVTPAGSISQLVLPDGSLIGMRPESELKITPAASGSDSRAPVVNLVNGTARVIGAELMDTKRTSNFTLQSGAATVTLKGADLESAVVKADAKPAGGVVSTGSYQRLLLGTGTVANGTQTATLAPQQVSYTGATNTPSVAVTAPAQNLFGGGAYRSTGNATNMNVPPKLANIVTQFRATAPVVQPPAQPPVVTPPVVVPPVKPCTRLIGKTCVP